MQITKLVASVSIALAVTTLATADEQDPQVTIEGRQANYREMGGAFKGIGDELKKSKPMLMLLRQHANQLSSLADSQAGSDWFPEGTGPEAGIKTAAKDEIWRQREDFDKWRAELATEGEKLKKLAETGDIKSLTEQHKSLGKVCAGCHKTFREKDD
jgi:cytochrome c556